MNESKSEFGLIDWIRQHQAGMPGYVTAGIGDDMAVMELGGQTVLVTTDMLLEGVHFDLKRCDLRQVGYKAMACSLSDCAAMACEPVGAVIAVALPRAMSMADCRELYYGIEQAAGEYHCPVIGGDTTSWDKPLAINVTMLGRMPEGERPVYRSGARVGDAIFVTGTLGGSLAGHHLNFIPRVLEARTLYKMLDLHAMMDLSDGLSSDLRHICKASGVAAALERGAIPISKAAGARPDPLSAALNDGEDFELLFCVGAEDGERLQAEWPEISDLQLTRIGRIIAADLNKDAVVLRDNDGTLTPVKPGGWEHFCGS